MCPLTNKACRDRPGLPPMGSQYYFTCSVIESSDDVASSYNMIGGSLSMARPIEILCFSPPEINIRLSNIF